ncbi:molybdenum cofactor biosynthesis protein MoeA [Acinetobacter wuhouensis]|uniref:SMI1/KNR4 family protein n=1 Tax=Acinetobacter wuhouensis TaxID=1879050 RepID=UPI00083A6793|nr:SMI1/KNR4 family protein [Acinetobacter wuhouensis]AXQ20820.1 molybdenum cofactor biosynthesis protein MoeA [Acinetobacter wuhouensis]
MQQLWQRLETILKDSHPSLLADLAPPATDSEIADLENQIGAKLPDDFIACLKIHNGQHGKADGLFDGSEFLSISRILQEWSTLKSVLDSGIFDELGIDEDASNNGIKSSMWNLKWIPFISYGNGDIWCLDLDPAEDGEFGQVFQYWYEDCETTKEANNFTEWFTNFIDQLK